MNIQNKVPGMTAKVGETQTPQLMDPFSFGQSLPAGPASDLAAYLTDAAQRSALFLDVMRQRGDQQKEITARPMATVLTFDHEIIMSGSSLNRPINFSLWRIVPPEGAAVDMTKRPVVIVDPRAGQGPGIGGFHYQSEIGDAFAAGHQVYFIGFAADPVPGQTFLDVVEGQVAFFERIVAMHPERSRPFAVGNCQAGYQTLMVAMLRPDLFGPILLSGSPVSCWQGVHGKNPMRYAGGLLGGSWLAHLASDLGNGRFDGAYLIGNFDLLNPANTFFDKLHHVYANVDTERERFLNFEKWWGDLIFLNGEEIEFLVDNHFIGDRLTSGAISTQDGRRFDIRSVTSPIVVFTSKGDNISPPQQTLGWILDNYKSVDEIRAHGQTIVYCVDPQVGHLAIFVSRKVAAREDAAFMQMMNVIDVAPPGLYELVVTPKTGDEPGADAVPGDILVRLEVRTLDDIRAFGRNSEADDRAFATMARWSDVALAGYKEFLQPWVRATASAQTAEWLQAMNPVRAQYAMFTSDRPWMQGVAEAAETARREREPVADDNPFLKMQESMAAAIDNAWNGFRSARDAWQEHTFFAIYGNPVIQTMLGITADQPASRRPPALTPEEEARIAETLAFYRVSIHSGDLLDARVRALLYLMSADHLVDARTAFALREIIQRSNALTIEAIREVVRQQFFALEIDRDAALSALPAMVPDAKDRTALLEEVRAIVAAAGSVSSEVQWRVKQLEALLQVDTTERTDAATVAPDVSDGDAPPPASAAKPPVRPAKPVSKAAKTNTTVKSTAKAKSAVKAKPASKAKTVTSTAAPAKSRRVAKPAPENAAKPPAKRKSAAGSKPVAKNTTKAKPTSTNATRSKAGKPTAGST